MDNNQYWEEEIEPHDDGLVSVDDRVPGKPALGLIKKKQAKLLDFLPSGMEIVRIIDP